MIRHGEYFATAGRAEPHFGGVDFTREDWAPMFGLVSGWDVPTDLYCLPPLRVATTRAGFFSLANCLLVPGFLPHVLYPSLCELVEGIVTVPRILSFRRLPMDQIAKKDPSPAQF